MRSLCIHYHNIVGDSVIKYSTTLKITSHTLAMITIIGIVRFRLWRALPSSINKHSKFTFFTWIAFDDFIEYDASYEVLSPLYTCRLVVIC